MPYFKIYTSFPLSVQEKVALLKQVTETAVTIFKVFPDKVQASIIPLTDSSISRGGVTPSQHEFSNNSRFVSQNFTDSYFQGKAKNEKLIIVELDVWANYDLTQKSHVFRSITQYASQEYALPGDNVLGIVREMKPENWFQNGVSGSNNDFLKLSRSLGEK